MGNKKSKSDVQNSNSNSIIIKNHEYPQAQQNLDSATSVKQPNNSTKPSQKINTSNDFSKIKFKLFITNQDINEIRKKKSQFVDNYFPPKFTVQTCGLPSEEFVKPLFQMNQIYSQNTESLATKFRWERTKVISYHLGKKRNEFVLDHNGHPLKDFTSVDKNMFSSNDVFQGAIGTCYFLALVLGLTRNLESVLQVMPIDNAMYQNIEAGAFHFRFWKQGSWYDLVVDDFLIVDFNHNVKLTANKTQFNEFWVCLLEKAWAKFAGKYSLIGCGGWFEDAALSLSGGTYDIYYTEILSGHILDPQVAGIKQGIVHHYGDVQTITPSSNELYQILSYALNKNNAIGIFSMQMFAQKHQRYGIVNSHQYSVSEVFMVGTTRYIKCQNPHNQPDRIKSFASYQQLEQKLIKEGRKKTNPGEFYMRYEEFIDCWQFVSVFNWFPEKELPELPEHLLKLKRKSTQFTQWKIVQFMERNLQGQGNGRPKFLIELKAKSNVMFTICSTYRSKTCTAGAKFTLNLFKLQNNLSNSYENYHARMEQKFLLFLNPGKYGWSIDSPYLEYNKNYCYRVFFDKKM